MGEAVEGGVPERIIIMNAYSARSEISVNLYAAYRDIGLVNDRLRLAISSATQLQALALMPLIERAALLVRDIGALHNAINEDR
jgi:hypothetical protein